MKQSLKQRTIFSLIMALALGVTMTLTASILHNNWGISTLGSFGVALVCGFLVTFFVPTGAVANWFSSLFKIKNRVLGVFVGGILGDLIATVIMLAIMTLFGLIMSGAPISAATYFSSFWGDFPLMYLVSYLTSDAVILVVTRPREEKTPESK